MSEQKLCLPEIQMKASVYKQNCKRLEELERYLTKRYRDDFNDVNWHGRLSLQRLFFQDAEVLAILSDKEMVKALLKRHREKKEKDLEGNNTLASLLCFALSANRLSYLVTAAPNWSRLPAIKDYSFGELIDGMGYVTEFGVEEKAFFASEARYLATVQRALQGVQAAFDELSPEEAWETEKEKSLREVLEKVSIAQMEQAFYQLVAKDQQAKNLIEVPGNGTTGPYLMANQAFGVMQHYEKGFLQGANGQEEKALGYGMVSHALDVRHLAAALYCVNAKKYLQDHAGLPPFVALIDRVKQSPDTPAATLMKARFQQLMRVLAEKQGIDVVLAKLVEGQSSS